MHPTQCRSRKSPAVLGTLAALTVLLASSTSQAASRSPNLLERWHVGPGRLALFVLFEGVAITGGTVSTIGMAATLDDAPEGWRTSGWVFGAMNTTGAAVMFAAAATSHEPRPWLEFAILQTALAAGNFALAAVSASTPDAGPKASLPYRAAFTPVAFTGSF